MAEESITDISSSNIPNEHPIEEPSTEVSLSSPDLVENVPINQDTSLQTFSSSDEGQHVAPDTFIENNDNIHQHDQNINAHESVESQHVHHEVPHAHENGDNTENNTENNLQPAVVEIEQILIITR